MTAGQEAGAGGRADGGGGVEIRPSLAFASESVCKVADVILPLAAWPETEGSFMNLEGRSFAVRPAGRPVGESRPGWKVLRRLGELCGLAGFDQVDLAEVRATMPDAPAAPEAGVPDLPAPDAGEGLHRFGEVPMYSADALCRRSASLQATVHAKGADQVGLNPADAARLQLADGDRALVSQGEGTLDMQVTVTATVPEGAALVRAATAEAEVLGAAMGPVSVQRNEGNAS